MPDEITPDIFSHLVDLAALELTPDEAEYLRAQLNRQLDSIHQLAAIPLDESPPQTCGATPPAAHGVPYDQTNSQPPREDAWQPHPNPGEILAQAPDFEDGYIIVPDIPHTKLE